MGEIVPLAISWNLLAVIAHIKMGKLNVSIALLMQWFDLPYTPQVSLLNIGVLLLSMLFTLKPSFCIQLLMAYHLKHGIAINLIALPFACFGTSFQSKTPGQFTAKLDKHAHDGIFLSYEGSSSENVIYLDVHSGHDSDGGNSNFDEAQCTSTFCLLCMHFLFDLGHHTVIPVHSTGTDYIIPTSYALFPPITDNCVVNSLPEVFCTLLLSYRELTTHTHLLIHILLAAVATLMTLEVMSIELSDKPLGTSFIESIPHSSLYPTAGLELSLHPL